MKEPITQEVLNDKLNLIIERLDKLEQAEVKTETLVKEEATVKEEPQPSMLGMTLFFIFCIFLISQALR